MFKTTFFLSTTVALTEPRPISSSALHVAVRSTRRSLNLLAGIPAVIVVQYQRKVFYSTVTTVVLLELLAVIHLVIIITSWPLLNVCVLNHGGAAKGQNRFVVAGVDWVSVCVGKACALRPALTSQPPVRSFSAALKICCTALGMTPRASSYSAPSMVYVFPLPVWP